MTYFIKVTNTNKFSVTDYFDGIPYKFAPNQPINVPPDAMRHMFGVEFPPDEAALKSEDFLDMVFEKVAKRWGWNVHDKEKVAEHRAALAKFLFLPIVMKQMEVVADNELLAPRENKKAKPTRLQNFKPEEETSGEEVA